MFCLYAGLQAAAQKAGQGQYASGEQQTSTSWELRKDQDGIRVYARTADSSRFDEVKVETILPGKISSLATLILYVANYPNWSFNSEKAYVVKRISPSEL